MSYSHPALLPDDRFNQQLAANVHPQDWVNPIPQGRYNLVVIGGGTAGLISAIGAAGLGARVALVERDLLGGDCLNVGCVPSKALIRASRAAAALKLAPEFGLQIPDGGAMDFGAAMQRMRRLRAQISPNDSAARYRDRGVDVFLGAARFTGPHSVEAAGTRLEFRKAVVATGARAWRPPIPGLEEAEFLTNETVFSLTELPRRLAVIGGGPIGCELAQAFARFGARTTIVDKDQQVLMKEDADAATRVQQALIADGVDFKFQAIVKSVSRRGAEKVLRLSTPAGDEELVVDEILAAVGRVPNVEHLGLEEAGIAFDPRRGIEVDDRLRTTNRDVFAAGDVCSPYKFTHAADAMARIVIQNALFLGRAKASRLVVPWCTYTDPEVAHVGVSEREAERAGLRIDTFVQELHEVDRAVLDGETAGFVKVHVKQGTDRIVGGTIVAAHAGEMIAELALAMTNRLGLAAVGRTIHPYPTQSEALKRVADAWSRTRLTPLVKRLFDRWLAWRR